MPSKSFSQRIGKTPAFDELQVDQASESLRTALWNAFWRMAIDDQWARPLPTLHDEYLEDIWEYFFKRPADEMPRSREIAAAVKSWLLECEWFEIYDFLEFVVTILLPAEVQQFETHCNRVLETERSAYRLIAGKVVPVSDALEVDEIATAMRGVRREGIDAAQEFLARAVEYMADRREPNYAGAVRNMLAAIDAVAKLVAGSSSASLPDALEAARAAGAPVPSPLAEGIARIYQTAPAGDEESGYEAARLAEARFIVVSGAALINYLLAAAGRPSLETGPRQERAPGLPGAGHSAPRQLPGDEDETV